MANKSSGTKTKGGHSGVRYITDDLIKKVTGQEHLAAVTSLNLNLSKESNKRFKFIENLEKLKKLRTLNLSYNIIEKMEKLERLSTLRELNLSFNNITKIEGIESITRLQVLNLTGNKIEHIPPWLGKRMKALQVFKIAKNQLQSLEEFSKMRPLKDLSQLTIADNPVASLPHCRSSVIFQLTTLEVIDGQPITDEERNIAHARFAQDEINKLLGQLEQQEAEMERINETHNHSLQEISSREKKQMQQLEKYKQQQESMKELKHELDTKTELLKRKTSELMTASHKHYELEQELAFYKIDHKFGALSAPPRLPTPENGSEVTDNNGLFGESPYIGKGRYQKVHRPGEKQRPGVHGVPGVDSTDFGSTSAETASVDSETRERRLQELDQELHEKQLAIATAQEHLGQLQDNLHMTEGQLRQATDELKKVAAVTPGNHLTEDDKQQIRSTLFHKINKVHMLQDEASLIEGEMERAEVELQLQQRDLGKLKSKLRRMGSKDALYSVTQKEVADKEQKLMLTQQQYALLQDQLSQMLNTIANETQNIKTLEAELREGQATQNDELKQELESIISGLQTYLSDVKTSTEKQRQECEALSRDKGDLEQRIQELEEENQMIDDQAGEISDLREKLADLEESLTQHQDHNSSLVKQLEESRLQEEHEADLSARLNEAEEEVERLKDEVIQAQEKAKKEMQDYQKKLDLENRKLRYLKDKAREADTKEDEIRNLHRELAELQGSNAHLQDQLFGMNQRLLEEKKKSINPEDLQRRLEAVTRSLKTGEPLDLNERDSSVGQAIGDIHDRVRREMDLSRAEAERAEVAKKKAEAEVNTLKDQVVQVQLKEREMAEMAIQAMVQEEKKEADRLKNELDHMKRELDRAKEVARTALKERDQERERAEEKERELEKVVPVRLLEASPMAPTSSSSSAATATASSEESASVCTEITAPTGTTESTSTIPSAEWPQRKQELYESMTQDEQELFDELQGEIEQLRDLLFKRDHKEAAEKAIQAEQTAKQLRNMINSRSSLSTDSDSSAPSTVRQRKSSSFKRETEDSKTRHAEQELARAEEEIARLKRELRHGRHGSSRYSASAPSHASTIASREAEIDDLRDLVDEQQGQIDILHRELDRLGHHHGEGDFADGGKNDFGGRGSQSQRYKPSLSGDTRTRHLETRPYPHESRPHPQDARPNPQGARPRPHDKRPHPSEVRPHMDEEYHTEYPHTIDRGHERGRPVPTFFPSDRPSDHVPHGTHSSHYPATDRSEARHLHPKSAPQLDCQSSPYQGRSHDRRPPNDPHTNPEHQEPLYFSESRHPSKHGAPVYIQPQPVSAQPLSSEPHVNAVNTPNVGQPYVSGAGAAGGLMHPHDPRQQAPAGVVSQHLQHTSQPRTVQQVLQPSTHQAAPQPLAGTLPYTAPLQAQQIENSMLHPPVTPTHSHPVFSQDQLLNATTTPVAGTLNMGQVGNVGQVISAPNTPGAMPSQPVMMSTPTAAGQSGVPLRGILKRADGQALPGDSMLLGDDSVVAEDGMICTVPEHHDLEDYVAKLQAKVKRLHKKLSAGDWSTIDDSRKVAFEESAESHTVKRLQLELQERRQDLESLDLAVERQKQHLKKMKDKERTLIARQCNNLRQLEALGVIRPSQSRRAYLSGEMNYNPDDEDLETEYVPRGQRSQRVTYLQEEIECLEDTLAKRRAELRHADKLLHDCQADVLAARKETKVSVDENRVAKQAAKQALLDVEELERRAHRAGVEVITTEERLEDLRGEAEDLQALCASQEDMLKQIQQIISKKDVEFQEIDGETKQALQRLEAVHNQLEEVTGEQQERVRDTKHSLADTKNQLSSVNLQISSGRSELEQINQDLGRGRTELQLLQDTIHKRQGQLDNLDHDVESEIEVKRREIQEVEEKLATLQTSRKRVDQEISDRRAQLEKIRNDIDHEETVLQNLATTTSKQKAQLRQLEESVEEKATELDVLKEQLKAKISQLQQTQNNTEEEAQTLSQLESDCRRRGNDLERLKQRQDHEHRELDALSGQRKSLEKTISEMQKEKRELEDNHNELNASLLELKRSQSETEGKLQRVNQQLSSLEREVTLAEEALDESRRERTELNSQLTAMRSNVHDGRVDLDIIQQSMKEAEGNMKKLEGELDIQKLRYTEGEEKLLQLEGRIHEAEQAFSTTKCDLEHAQIELSVKRDELQHTEAQLELLQRETGGIHSMRQNYMSLEERVRQLGRELVSREKDATKLTGALEKARTELRENQNQFTKEIKFLREKAANEIADLEGVAQTHCSRANRLSDELNDLRTEHATLLSKLESEEEKVEQERKFHETLLSLKADMKHEVYGGDKDLLLETDSPTQRESIQQQLETLKKNLHMIRTGADPLSVFVRKPEDSHFSFAEQQDFLKRQLEQKMSRHVEAMHSKQQLSQHNIFNLQKKLSSLEKVLSSSSGSVSDKADLDKPSKDVILSSEAQKKSSQETTSDGQHGISEKCGQTDTDDTVSKISSSESKNKDLHIDELTSADLPLTSTVSSIPKRAYSPHRHSAVRSTRHTAQT